MSLYETYLRNSVKKLVELIAPRYLDSKTSESYLKQLPTSFIQHVNRLKSSSVTVDIGANVGLVSLILSKKSEVVHAFEPSSTALKKLREKALRHRNIVVHGKAAGIKNREQKLYYHNGHDHDDIRAVGRTQSCSLRVDKPTVSDGNFKIITEIDFAEFLSDLDRYVDIIKIDVEGYEIDLVNHMLDRCNFEKIGKIYVETHHHSWPSLKTDTEKMIARVEAMGLSDKFDFDWI